MKPSFLPPMLNLDGTWENVLSMLYSVFERDFKKSKTYHRAKRVLYDGRLLEDGKGKEEGFWHVISRGDKTTDERMIDCDRARRLPWAKPMMESSPRQELLVFDHYEGSQDRGIRRYIWLRDFDHVVILQPRRWGYYWITAFYVDLEVKRSQLMAKYKKAAAAPKDGP